MRFKFTIMTLATVFALNGCASMSETPSRQGQIGCHAVK